MIDAHKRWAALLREVEAWVRAWPHPTSLIATANDLAEMAALVETGQPQRTLTEYPPVPEKHVRDHASDQAFTKLHVYAQSQWHGDAFVVGSPAALRALRDACDAALADSAAHAFLSYTQDGEGFVTFVVPVVTGDDQWDKLPLPYTDPIARDRAGDRLVPYMLIPNYRDLARGAK